MKVLILLCYERKSLHVLSYQTVVRHFSLSLAHNFSGARVGSSTSTLGRQEVSKGGPVTGHREKFVGNMFKYAVLDIKPTYNH